jgi:hypothetical protein
LAKILPLLGVILMVLHIIRPIGVPGLRQRRDFWKIALVMLAALGVIVLLRE